MESYWKQTGKSIQVARLSGMFGREEHVSAFGQKDREEHNKIVAAVKAEWESVE